MCDRWAIGTEAVMCVAMWQTGMVCSMGGVSGLSGAEVLHC